MRTFLRDRRNREVEAQATRRSRGKRIAKIHALSDRNFRLVAFLLIGGLVADLLASEVLVVRLIQTCFLHGNKAYDSEKPRRQAEDGGRGSQHSMRDQSPLGVVRFTLQLGGP